MRFDDKRLRIDKKTSVIISCLVFLVLYIYYYFLFLRLQCITSDMTTMFPLLRDWMSGNILLKHWIVGSNSFFFTDTVWCIPGELLGLAPIKTIGYAGALFHSGLVVLLLYVFLLDSDDCVSDTYLNSERHINLIKALSVVGYVVFSVVLPYSSVIIFLNINTHSGTLMFVAVEYLILNYWFNESNLKKSLLLALGYTFVGVLLFASDSFSLLFLFLPVCAFSVYYLIKYSIKKEKELFDKYLLFLFFNAVTMLLGKFINDVNERFGGLVIKGLPMKLMLPSEAIKRIPLFYKQIFVIFGSDSESGNPALWYKSLIFVVTVLLGLAMIWQLLLAVKGRPDYKGFLLTLVILCNIAGCLIFDVAVTSRYVVTVPVMGSLLIFRSIMLLPSCINIAFSCKRYSERIALSLAVVMIVVSSLYFGSNLNLDAELAQESADAQKVVEYLQTNNLGNGYAEFWCSSMISSYSNFDNLIIQVERGETGIVPCKVLVNEQWYDQTDIHYILLYAEDEANTELNMYEVIESFGPADEDVTIGIYRLLYYDKDISDCLVRE